MFVIARDLEELQHCNDFYSDIISCKAIYRFRSLGTVTASNVDSFIADLYNLSYRMLRIGSHFTITDGQFNTIWFIADICRYTKMGSPKNPDISITLIPRTKLINLDSIYTEHVQQSNHDIIQMNSTDTTGVSQNPLNPLYEITQGQEMAGYQGYYGSDMNQIYMPAIANQMKQVFGNHLTPISVQLSNTIKIDSSSIFDPALIGYASSYGWCDVEALLPSEIEFTGYNMASAGVGGYCIGNGKLALYNFVTQNSIQDNYLWLRSVANRYNFNGWTTSGYVSYNGAQSERQIRPMIEIVK